MAKIIEITESHIIVLENNIKMKINIDYLKFAPRLNDIITLVRNEQGNITNIFLVQNEPQPIIIQQHEHEEQPVIVAKPSRAKFASKFVGIFNIVFWLIMIIGVYISLKDPAPFVEPFIELQLELYLIPIILLVILGISIAVVVLGIVLLLFKNKYVKLIAMIPSFFIYLLLLISSFLSIVITPVIAYLQVAIFGVPFYQGIIFLKHYKTL